jgi:hypothetical protein
VKSARRAAGSWALQVGAAHENDPRSAADARDARGCRLTELRTHSPTLEDVFVTLTGGACAMTPDRSTRVKNTADNTPAIAQLTLSRFREFYREPEAVFWVFIFPILLAGGLGIAFRNRPAEASHIAVATKRGE